ncbi:MAG: hypothetical protein QM747_15810 [Nocardioides sp.]
MRWIVCVLGAAVVLAGCGSHSPVAGPPAPTYPDGPRGVTIRVVEHVLATAPLPNGARIATSAEARGKGPQSWPRDNNLVERHRTYLVPLGLSAALQWFTVHPPRALQSNGGTSTASGPDGVTAEGLEFDGPSTHLYNSLEEQVGVFPVDDSHSVVRIDGMATWLPQPTTAERVPADSTAVVGFQVTGIGDPRRHFHLTGHPMRELAHLLNHQWPINNFGLINCPNDDGRHDLLRFTGGSRSPVFQVPASGCDFISVTADGSRQPALNGGYLVDKLLTRLLAQQARRH